ncbi:uncharacterized protein EDB91DRAFT_1089861 [Suillus paluster]|uniref:uncharacterized protein n=1 Tax=Suillus paluster TaxID=48578 RepID=UPI001B863A9C|nr:uncharacterized protein EDB91DRAFT_1089861 [Suillus paluster]KAG1718702.1 hypothetical protein EDB91DRAFT_1089861 [Suillus paluster]
MSLCLEQRLAQRQANVFAICPTAMSLGPTPATTDCRNLKQGTQPRKANRNCIRRYCKQCCEVVGGCRVHRVASISPPVAAQQHESSIIPPLATVNPTSTQLDHPPVTIPEGPSTTSQSLTTTQSLPAASRVYARPLDPNYARNYVLGHQRTLVAEQRFQADQSLSIMIRNMIDVVLWLKNNDPPHLVRLTCTTPGKFVPGDHSLLMRFDLGDYIAVYCSDQHAWIEQDIKTPLLSPPNSTILLRSIDLTDNHTLHGFTERVLSLSRTPATVQSPSKRAFSATGMHLSRLDGITSPLKWQRNASSNNAASRVLISPQLPTPLPLIESPSPTVTSPLSLTAGDSDTSPASATVQPNASATVPPDDQMIQTLFATTFPNCTYTKATFYKHRAAYRAAIRNSGDKVEYAVNAGYSPAGLWNTLLAEIKANTLSLTGSNGLGSVSNSDVKCHILPPSLLSMDPSTTDTELLLTPSLLPADPSTTDTGLLPTDLTGDMSDALASLFWSIEEMNHDTIATTNSEFPLDFTSYPQIDPFPVDTFPAWLNDPSPVARCTKIILQSTDNAWELIHYRLHGVPKSFLLTDALKAAYVRRVQPRLSWGSIGGRVAVV